MNLILSWLSAALTLILLLLFPARKLVERRNPEAGGALSAVYRIMRKTHCAIGILVIPVVYFHCRIAAQVTGVRSMFGAALLALLVLLALSYLLRKLLGRYWMWLHRILASLLTLVMAYHCLVEF